MPDIQPVNALYYPRLHFGSPGWASAALLYWEGLLRLVPDGVPPNDSPEVDALVERGLIESVSPARYFRSTAEAFEARLEDLLRTQVVRVLGLDRQSGSLIHVGQVDPSLLRSLQSRGLAAVAGQWVSMSPEIAALYKLTLANEAAKDRHAAPTTDETGFDVAAALYLAQKLDRGAQPSVLIDGFSWARCIDPFPQIEGGPPTAHEMVALRGSLATERRKFRERVQARAADIGSLPSLAAVESQLDDFSRELKAEVNARMISHRASSARSTWAVARTSAPFALGAAIAAVGAPMAVAVAGLVGSVGVGVTDWVVQRRHARRNVDNYLVALEDELKRLRPRTERAPSPIPDRTLRERIAALRPKAKNTGRLGR
jgi:hypothetical protein